MRCLLDHERGAISSRGEGLFKTQGKILKFDGYRRVLPPAGKQEDQLLPHLAVGQSLDLNSLESTQHFTQPPPRYSEATLIKALEKEDIGRPSTYAPIIQTIQDRNYVEQKDRRFFATELGMIVTEFLVKHFPKIMDLKFTAYMEDELDDIATAKENMTKVLDELLSSVPRKALADGREARMVARAGALVRGLPRLRAHTMVVKFSKTGQVPRLASEGRPRVQGNAVPMDGRARPARRSRPEHKCTKCGKATHAPRRRKARDPSCRVRAITACKGSLRTIWMRKGNPFPLSSRPSTFAKSADGRWLCGKARAADR